MRNRNLILFSLLVLAVAFATGCAKRGMTKSDMDRADAIAAKIARAEKMGIEKCNPKELADAKAALDHARQEAAERHAKAASYFAEADKAADNLIALIGPCMEKMAPKPSGEPTTGMAPPEPPPPPPPVAIAQPAPVMFENIHFDFDKSFIRKDAKPILQAVAEYLKKNPDAKVQIEGHCDERGTSEYNIALGQRRADSTKKYLANLGVDGSRLSTISYGEEKPADPGHNEAAWAKNRRAVFVIR
ncbi:MAG: peptidoglycan-associated lipoprotein Pal [Candidatus Deferrimicrobiaceae bacterium]